ncbi:uncharacterized protein LOC113848919 isoform X2 [Abrus precatorius]|uniref:tRNA (guanine(46)-N(7))-methyltransferase n=1 Tax=Abrus precatorius TaxID=3816 RepID=A0A8B8JRN1_ABRPR|nr:uncharacterized protein LOC113848919 isoform X2 [Abrus precatorius]
MPTSISLTTWIWVTSGSGNMLIPSALLSPFLHKYQSGTKSLQTRHCHSWWISDVIVKRAELWVKDLALDNIHFLFANATISFKQLVESYPGPLVLVSILCPDPHFKKRHHKRRVLQKPLVGAIVDNLMPGGQVFVQSDVLDVALDMRNQFDEVDSLKHTDALNLDMLCDNEGWLLSNPMGIRTEREIHAELEGAKIYRRLYQKQK